MTAEQRHPRGLRLRFSEAGEVAAGDLAQHRQRLAEVDHAVSPGRLLAYDATAFGTFGDGSEQLRVLWDSQDWNLTFSFCKFTPPVVGNGKLYVPTYDARVDVYGLA